MDAETGMDAETRIGCRNPKWMQKPKMDAETKNGCRNQKWMQKPELDAETQLLYNTINVAYLLFKV